MNIIDVDARLKLITQNKKRIIGAICRHIINNYGKYDKDLPILKTAVENTVNDLINHKERTISMESILHYKPDNFKKSGFIEAISNRVYSEYSRLIKEKHAQLRRTPGPNHHSRMKTRPR